ncbi:MAG: response regulator [Aphanothece sp. CMT-3BRIN-NPC111]|jgi:PAS domain S-box-containing protein|nr:response regulator [Aphanothece sp. CMT-3BRIN-NPC111]
MNITESEKHSPLVLVVDDDKFMRIQQRLAMEQAGYRVAEANDGEQALAAFTSLHPDIVLLDAMMPVMDGFTFCHLLHTFPEEERIPVLMITALEDQESVDRAFEAGAIDYITKPIHWGVLRQRVRRLLQESQATKELKQQTQRALVSEEQLRCALDAAHMSSWDWHIPSGSANESASYEAFLRNVHPEDQQLVRQAVVSAIEQEADYDINMEVRVLQPDSTIRWVAKKGRVFYDQAGSTVLLAGVDMDITERKCSEQKISEQAALLDIATDAIFVQDLENQVLFWNKSAERLYGWKADEMIGNSALELFSRETLPQFHKNLKILTQEGEWQGELNQVTKKGKKIIVESRWTLVRDRQGKSKSILIVNTDITEKKKLEVQFLRAQRMESLGTLAGGIAHDLNNVLAPIMMAVQLLELKLDDEQSQQLLSIMETNVKRGADLIRQVLSFARGIEGERANIQVGHLITEIKKIASKTFPKYIDIRIDVQTRELWTVSGDATQLHQVLMNLCVNARDAMPDGGTLNISAENFVIDEHYVRINPEAKVGPYIVITISDTGIGIPPEILDRIFEPFFTTKDVGKGTGLGLSTVIGIIKSHGGFINVYSEVEKGTQFKVYLPATKTLETHQVTDNSCEKFIGRGELILVVDDEASICEVTKTSLEISNYRVITASDGIEALALYAQHKEEISVVLIDMMMPSMDGSTAIRMMQKMNQKVKIVAASGFTFTDKVTDVARLGVKTFLHKPYTTDQLLKTLHEVINKKSN